jgi:hypothetical protein
MKHTDPSARGGPHKSAEASDFSKAKYASLTIDSLQLVKNSTSTTNKLS